YAFGRVLIVRAAGGVDVMVAGEPAEPRRIDPPLERDGELARTAGVDAQLLRLRDVLRSAARRHRVRAVGQAQRFAIGSVDLRLEGKIGREALRLVRIDAAEAVSDQE